MSVIETCMLLDISGILSLEWKCYTILYREIESKCAEIFCIDRNNYNDYLDKQNAS